MSEHQNGKADHDRDQHDGVPVLVGTGKPGVRRVMSCAANLEFLNLQWIMETTEKNVLVCLTLYFSVKNFF